MRIVKIVDIDAPPPLVFDLIADPEQRKRWLTGLIEDRFEQGTHDREGAAFQRRIEEGGVEQLYQGRILAWEPGRRVAWYLGSNAYEVEKEFRLSDLDAGRTRLDYTAAYRSTSWWVGIVMTFFWRATRRITDQQMQRLAQVAREAAEAQSGPAQ